MKARIIHLERHTERKKRCEANVRRLKKIQSVWVDAVDAKQLSLADVGIFGVKNTVAIRMSHMKCWQQFLDDEDRDEHCLILEDDAHLDLSFESILFEKMRHLSERNEDWDLLYCGHFEIAEDEADRGMSWLWQFLSRIGSIGHQAHRNIETGLIQPRFALGAHAYVLTRKGARKCLDAFKADSKCIGVRAHVDVGLQTVKDLTFMAIVPPIATQAPSTQNSSFAEEHTFPRFLNAHLDRYKNPYGMSYAYMMTAPVLGVCGFIVNGWVIIGAFMGVCAVLLLFIMQDTPWRWLLLFITLLYIMDGVFYEYLIEQTKAF